MVRRIILALAALAAPVLLCAAVKPGDNHWPCIRIAGFNLPPGTKAPEPFGAIPSKSQMEWQKMEMNMFIHFGPNTFSGLEWGEGSESEDLFNPGNLDCRQWARTAKAAGFKGIIITAKHHDGFCLWPNEESLHTVAQSKWKGGKGDVLKELSDACREYGLKFGVYLSPWDRNDPDYGSPSYNAKYARALRSIHDGRYGEIFEQWFDGACGEGPNGKKQEYDWRLFSNTVKELSPNAIMFGDIGPGCRWMGNERGVAAETNWSTLDTQGLPFVGFDGDTELLQHGKCGGNHWVPAETDVSIRKGWFWKENENETVKSVDQLFDIYLSSVGRNSLLLLNVPPDTRGRIHEIDSTRLIEFKAELDRVFGTDLAAGAKASADISRGKAFRAENVLNDDYDSYWAAPDGIVNASIILELPEERCFNLVSIQEYIPLGQRVNAFTVEVWNGKDWEKIAEGSTIGYKRIIPVQETTTKAIRLNITGSLACPTINKLNLYKR